MRNKRCMHLALIMLLLISFFCITATAEIRNPEIVDDGYVSVDDFGADGSDTKDDYPAFQAALATGKNICIPKGNYYLSDTIVLNNRICRGTEPGKTKILGTSPDVHSPIILIEGCSSLYDVMLYYSENTITGSEKQGERVALQLGSAGNPVTRGTVIRSIYIIHTGTALYSPADTGCSGALIENVEIKFFSYRGVDMQSENRVMNSYSNLYITSFTQGLPEVNVDSGFALEGSEYGATLNQINVEHDGYNYPVILKNQKGLNASTIHIEGANLLRPDSGYIYCDNASGYIGTVTVFFTYISTYNNHIIQFGDSDGTDALVIGITHLRGLNAPDTASHPLWVQEITNSGNQKGLSVGGDKARSFKLFGRDENAEGLYEALLNYNSYYCYVETDMPYYEEYGSGNNLTISVNNQ